MIFFILQLGAIASATNKVSGSIGCGDQYHFHLETQTSICTPSDLGGMNVKASSQWLDGILITVAQVLGLPESSYVFIECFFMKCYTKSSYGLSYVKIK